VRSAVFNQSLFIHTLDFTTDPEAAAEMQLMHQLMSADAGRGSTEIQFSVDFRCCFPMGDCC